MSITANKFALENSLGENQSEENLRRDTYVVKNAKPQASSETKPNPSTPKPAKPAGKGNSVVKTKKVVVSTGKKKLSPPSGNLTFKNIHQISDLV